MESNMGMKNCKVLRGSIEIPRDSLAHKPLFDTGGHAISPGANQGEFVVLEADEATLLAARGIVQIFGDA
jgi:hypothetical protein